MHGSKNNLVNSASKKNSDKNSRFNQKKSCSKELNETDDKRYVTKKRFGQHFLKNKYIVNKIVSSLPSQARRVIEIGPGHGALTCSLLKQHIVCALEIDNDCVQFLQQEFHQAIENNALQIIHCDVLEHKISFQEDSYVVGNLPYNVGTKIIEKFVYEKIACGVFMLQKEVAERITGISYSRLGVFVQARYDVAKIIDVSRNDFCPKPKVESQVIRLVGHNRLDDVDLSKLNDITKTMFANRRKKLSSLKKTHVNLVQQLIACNIDLNLRAEELPKEIYYMLAKKSCEKK